MNKKFIYSTAIIVPSIVTIIGCSCEPKPLPTQPNVIVIIADDLGYGDISCNGSTTISTPNMDFLANKGVRFTDGHATSATSTPSRYAMFTGSYPWKNPNAKILPGDAPLLIDVNQYTMPKMFKSKGYTTAAIGKWHLGMGDGSTDWNKRVVPGANEIGFDYSCLIAATNDRVPTVYVENGTVVGLDPNDPIEVSYIENFDGEPTALTNPEMLKMHWAFNHNNSIVNGISRIGYMKGGAEARWKDEDMADYFVDKVKSFITTNKEKPFFLYYGLHQPHVPRAPHSRFVGSTTMGPRGDAIMEADWCVGELIKKLKDEGLLENTLIVFSSDNGPVLNDGYKDDAVEKLGNHTPSKGLRGGKYSLFDAGTRVPFFAYWKGHIKPMVSDAFVTQLDLLASFGELIGIETPKELDSKNYLSTLLGRESMSRPDFVIEAEGRLAYRRGNYALIPPYEGDKYNIKNIEVGNLKEYSLYDLSTDWSQEVNIIKDNKELAEDMKHEFYMQTNKYMR